MTPKYEALLDRMSAGIMASDPGPMDALMMVADLSSLVIRKSFQAYQHEAAFQVFCSRVGNSLEMEGASKQ